MQVHDAGIAHLTPAQAYSAPWGVCVAEQCLYSACALGNMEARACANRTSATGASISAV